MNIKINRLILQNFKGIRNLTVQPDGADVSIYGDNATGKTTVFDAVTWLLFGKDSLGRADFGIKTQDESGNTLHNLEHSVECEFCIDDTLLTLKKVFVEKWTKKRGSAEAEFTGHETKYFTNEVPTTKKEYENKIAGFIDEELFKIITNPLYFNEHLKWQERRQMLVNMCGNITDAEILECDADFKPLIEKLQGRTVTEYKKVITSKQQAINEELKQLPVKISEALRAIPENIENVDVSEKEAILSGIEELKQKIQAIKNGAGVVKADADLTVLKYNRLEEKGKVADVTELTQKLRVANTELDNANFDIQNHKNTLDAAERMIVSLTATADILRKQWYEVNQKQYEGDNVCPFCKQTLPQEQIENALQKFNAEKVAQLEDITERGKRATSGIEAQQLIVDGSKKLIAELTAKIENEIKPEIEKITVEIENVKQAFAAEQAEKIKALDAQIAQIEKQIANNNVDTSGAVIELQNKINEEQAKVDRINKAIATSEIIESQKKRAEELEKSEKTLAKEYSQLEAEAFLIDKFIRFKVSFLSEKINSMFKFAKFKLFENQINGGINECCEVTYKGVEYCDLNNASRINIGLDIINTLCTANGKNAPVIVDNAESVTDILPTTSQQIRLIVSGADKVLRVEKGV